MKRASAAAAARALEDDRSKRKEKVKSTEDGKDATANPDHAVPRKFHAVEPPMRLNTVLTKIRAGRSPVAD
eukprot:9201222-Alexandrium_andersonii.AAC.1